MYSTVHTISVQCTSPPNYVIPIPTYGSCTSCLWHSLAASLTKYSNICQVLTASCMKELVVQPHLKQMTHSVQKLTGTSSGPSVAVFQLDFGLDMIVIYDKMTVGLGCCVTWWRDHSRMSLCLEISANVVLTLQSVIQKEIRTSMPAGRKTC